MAADPPPPVRHLCPRGGAPIAERGLTPRVVKDLQNGGYLSRIRATGSLTLVDVVELDRYLDARTDPAVYGPLAGGGGDLDALVARYRETGDPEAASALVAIAQKVDSAIAGES